MNPTVGPRSMSPRAKELHDQLESTIRHFRDRHPRVTDDEIRGALALSTQSLSPHSGAIMAVAAAALVLVFTAAMIYLF